ncbi:type I restriction enzyme HsdR N-terminal domain-containing protein [Arthrobacter sp. JSM 101049]|uniref:type I restriction enzyme HsdR N-terminal domain-containing protein n=1 Tax=Arthrobacter sp. JSM 101049 TaxID=929097 RepID=UPI0035633E86
MELSERLAALAAKVKHQRGAIETEEATKNAFIMPFISTVLGYDVFNPLEVIPEFTADVGIKKGEKIDYAIVKDDEVQILIECKRSLGPLTIENASQLFRYFAATTARIAVLTNGEIYQFYTDLEAPNRMDSKPFLILDLSDIDETLVPEIQKLSKEVFDLESIINSAEELKYIGHLKRVIGKQFQEPDENWVKLLSSQVYDGVFTARVREQFSGLVKKASRQFLSDQVNDRLKAALRDTSGPASSEEEMAASVNSAEVVEADLADDGVETTFEELEGFQIVRAIVCSHVKPHRVVYRDAKSYCAVLLDDNNRRPIARLHFNRSQKYLGVFDDDKVETRHPISSLDEIYGYAEQLRETAARHTNAAV